MENVKRDPCGHASQNILMQEIYKRRGGETMLQKSILKVKSKDLCACPSAIVILADIFQVFPEPQSQFLSSCHVQGVFEALEDQKARLGIKLLHVVPKIAVFVGEVVIYWENDLIV